MLVLFARRAGLGACLQAVCTRVLAHLHRVLARRWAYSHKALANKSPCLQVRAVLFASHYTYPLRHYKLVTGYVVERIAVRGNPGQSPHTSANHNPAPLLNAGVFHAASEGGAGLALWDARITVGIASRAAQLETPCVEGGIHP